MGVSIENLYGALREATQEDIELFEDKLSQIEPLHTDDNVKQRFLQPTHVLPWSLLDQVQQFPQSRGTDYKDFLTIPEPINRTSFHLRRKGIDGHVSSYEEEVNLKEVANANAANSLSLNRGMDPHANSVRGSTAQLPFMPGGVSMTAVQTTQGVSSVAASTKMLHKDDQGLFDVPRGFERGIEPVNAFIKPENQDRVDELQELDQEDNELEVQKEFEEQQRDLEESVERRTTRGILGEEADVTNDDKKPTDDIDELLPMGIDFARKDEATPILPAPPRDNGKIGFSSADSRITVTKIAN